MACLNGDMKKRGTPVLGNYISTPNCPYTLTPCFEPVGGNYEKETIQFILTIGVSYVTEIEFLINLVRSFDRCCLAECENRSSSSLLPAFTWDLLPPKLKGDGVNWDGQFIECGLQFKSFGHGSAPCSRSGSASCCSTRRPAFMVARTIPTETPSPAVAGGWGEEDSD